MEHLSSESLSRLVDEAPTVGEGEHLGVCSRCRSELEAVRLQTSALAELPDVRPPRGDWEGLRVRLAAEGLLREAPGDSGIVPIKRSRWFQSAAAVMLFLAGTAAGAGMMTPPGGPDPGEVPTTPVSSVATTTDPGTALAHMQEAEQAYIEALVHYRELVGARGVDEASGDPSVRYAALEELVRAGQAALSQAPADPFLNGLLASALAEREAVSRRLSGGDAVGQDGWF